MMPLCNRTPAVSLAQGSNRGRSEIVTKLLLVHLSDIHVRSEQDAILGRAEQIIAAVRNLDYELEAAIIAVSGDLAFSGSESQYEAVWVFLSELAARLREELSARERGSSVPVTILAIPGNHDCDFTGVGGVRNMVIDGVLANPQQAADASVVDLCTEVQRPFFEALGAYGANGLGSPTSEYDRYLAYQYDVLVGDRTVQFLCFNTAWLSLRHEAQGRLYLPAGVVPTPPQNADFVVAMFHHPYNWMEANAARAFRKRIEATADLILSGHEHDATRRTQAVSTGESNEYVEGGVLQDSADPTVSTFNAFVLDITGRKQKATEFTWDGVRYVPLGVDGDAGDDFSLEWEDLQVARLRARDSFELNDTMQKNLDDLGISLAHRERGLLGLSDVFIFPDLQEVTHSAPESGRRILGDDVVDLVKKSPRLLILGDTDAGKTCLAKMVFRQLHQAGYVPVLIDAAGKLPTGERLYAKLVRLFDEQYSPCARDTYRQLDRGRRVIIVDNYHLASLNVAVRRNLIEDLTRFAAKVILLADDFVTEASDLLDPQSRVDGSAPFATFRILPLGHLRREAMIDKWLLLDDVRDVTPAEFAQRRQGLTTTLNSLVGRNLLPPYPVYVLAVLQAEEALTPWDSHVSTYGAYYELLIRSALASGRSPVQSDIVLNYLAHFAYDLFRTRRSAVDNRQLREIHRRFEQRYMLEVSMHSIRADLVNCHILAVSNDLTQFKYKYIYYYFVARWFRDHIGEDEIRSALQDLTRSVHVEAHANILLFLAHLSKEPFIVEAMLEAAHSFYPDHHPVTFTDDIEFLASMKRPDHQLVYQDGNVDENRRAYLAALDEQEAGVASIEQAGDEDETAEDLLNPISMLNAAMKTLQILGQVLKNFPGSLDGDVKLEIAQECYDLGLRTLSWLYEALRENEEYLVGQTADVIRKSHPTLTQKQIEIRARNLIVSTAEVLGLILIRLISSAVGSPELDRTYDRLEEQEGTPAVQLINVSIRLDHSTGFPEGTVCRQARDLANRPFARAILSYLVLMRFHLFPVAPPTKRRVCSALGIQYTPRLAADPRHRLITGS